MRRRTVMILVGVLAVGGLGASLVAVFRPFEEGPRYKGLPASYWRMSLLDWRKSQGGSPSPLTRLQTLLGLCSNGGQPAILRGDPATLPMLLQLIRDEDSSVSGEALYALKNLRATKALWRAIVEKLNDKDTRIHSIAEGLLFSFGNRADSNVLPVLSELLQHDESNIRTESLNIVIHLGPDAAPVVPELARMLHGGWPLRYYAAVALKSVGPDAPSAIPGLVNMLNDEDELCRGAAADALRHIDPEAAKTAGVK
jgi:HEAT repeat protein